jgi:hypothetical protein
MAASPVLSTPPNVTAPAPQPTAMSASNEQPLPNRLTLELRGERVQIARDTLVNLPESVLVVMFPNGLILGPRGSLYVADDGNPSLNGSEFGASDDEDEDGVVQVDFDPNLLRYILSFYESPAETNTQPTTGSEDGVVEQAPSDVTVPVTNAIPGLYSFGYAPLERRAFIVLREELDYFAIPCTNRNHQGEAGASSVSVADNATDVSTQQSLKHLCGEYLVSQNRIFDALRYGRQRSITDATQSVSAAAALSENMDQAALDSANGAITTLEEASAAERQLVEMLCLAGFGVDDVWGYRTREPGRCCVVSVGIVRLVSDGTPAQMAAAQKLLVFWRKPARKCWWDGTVATIGTEQPISVRIWSRRTWTLELALI